MSRETIWAPWRLEYILSDKSGACIFCQARDASKEKLKDNLVLSQGKHSFVLLNKYPYQSGHLMILPKKHTDEMDELDSDVLLEMQLLLAKSIRVLKKTMNPDGFNIGMNIGSVAGAGVLGHLHIHVVPRWNGDNNFMPMLSETNVIPIHLSTTFDLLAPEFEKIEL